MASLSAVYLKKGEEYLWLREPEENQSQEGCEPSVENRSSNISKWCQWLLHPGSWTQEFTGGCTTHLHSATSCLSLFDLNQVAELLVYWNTHGYVQHTKENIGVSKHEDKTSNKLESLNTKIKRLINSSL